ncbi:hypothetical protein WR25_01378 [Diploscapter pachys]|uniref:Uncharacterized protein n=1 Tax=Diploscapter pachys TaxID=2018661 RepID=A0A2A2K7Z5_9BILA|nr:hypothetical protein WR25_01378 [Diploscapter pachys]
MLISLGRIGAKVDAAAAASFDRTSDIASTVSASASASARFVFGGNQQAPVDPARLVPVAVMRAAPPGSVAEPTAPTATNSFPASVCVCYCVAGSDVRLPPRGASWISLK